MLKMKHSAIILISLILGDYCNAAARSKSRMPVTPIKLYYLLPSPPCRAVMMTAKVLGLELDLVVTNIMEGAHKTPEFLKLVDLVMNTNIMKGAYMTVEFLKVDNINVLPISKCLLLGRSMYGSGLLWLLMTMNPQHTIPTMDDNGFILWESRAIMAYLVNAYGKDDSIYPKNPRQRALVDARMNFDVGTLFPRYLALYLPMLFRGEEYNEEAAAKLTEALGWLNIMLDSRAFVAGDSMTIADISIIITITNLHEFDFDMSAHENVLKWFERTKKELEPYGYEEIDVAGAQILASFLKKE